MPDETGPGTTTAPSGEPDNGSPPQVFMPLLDYITAHSMDGDYAHVAARDGGGRRPPQIRPGLAALVVMGLFGLLVTTAGVQTARNAGEESGSRASLITQVKARSAQVDARRTRVAKLRQEIESLQRLYLETTSQGRMLSTRLDRLGASTGALAVTGSGVKVVVDDAPGAVGPVEQVLDEDLQKLANALWASGAEAVSINGQRLTSLSAIRTAGQAITVNQVSLRRPYTVLAIGNPDTMPARFVETEHGQDWLDLHTVNRLQFTMTAEESLRLPAAPGRRLTLRHATQRERR
jgi:uncharacterized protein YlxW (UPF0749 family)